MVEAAYAAGSQQAFFLIPHVQYCIMLPIDLHSRTFRGLQADTSKWLFVVCLPLSVTKGPNIRISTTETITVLCKLSPYIYIEIETHRTYTCIHVYSSIYILSNTHLIPVYVWVFYICYSFSMQFPWSRYYYSIFFSWRTWDKEFKQVICIQPGWTEREPILN